MYWMRAKTCAQAPTLLGRFLIFCLLGVVMSMHGSNGGKDSSLSWSLGVRLPRNSMRY